MAGWSFGFGKIFGVEIRLHSFFLFLLVPSMAWAGAEGRMISRGVALWALLLLAVVVREVARAIAAACWSLDVRSLLLLPTGGLFGYAGLESEQRAAQTSIQRSMALAGPAANLLFGLVIAGFVKTISPGVSLVEAPWISPAHLVRAMVWVNLMLGALNLLPAWPLDAARVVHGEVTRRTTSPMVHRHVGSLLRMGFWLALSMICYGILNLNWWVVMAGLGVLLGSQLERQGLLPERQGEGTTVGDVMLTDYSMLPASATLEDAMMQARHSLQDIFPVVRAGNMVGAVGRQNILDALAANGNGYVQGIMTRSFQTAQASDSLAETLNRAVGKDPGSTLQIVPVVEGEMVVGILTPQHLQRSLGLIARTQANNRRLATEDETN